MDYQNYKPLKSFRDLIDWQFDQANACEKEYIAKYYPNTEFKEYTYDDLVNPSISTSNLQRVGEAQRRWYNKASYNKNGIFRSAYDKDTQDIFYTLVKYYIDRDMLHHVHIAGDTISYCDQAWLSTWPTTMWCCTPNKSENVFVYGLYRFLFKSWQDDFNYKIKWDEGKFNYMKEVVMYFTQSTEDPKEVEKCKDGNGNFVLCKYMKSKFIGDECPDSDWEIINEAFEESFIAKFGLREITGIQIKDTREYKK